MKIVSGVVSFFREGWGELKRVRWPSRKELLSYTVVVLTTCIIMAIVIFLFDLGVSELLKLIGLGR
ncbi:preprotein translocase subunit SecE [Effusibacillus lacus]|uniref:preprotein translocase subunit SecE n=1 Tax=Effusibacillus lacus TaxID=1348429 RepID=UPI000BB6E666|nr:preprotein translocase subunit SecE [Effusibacillus lacus]TCS69158.1 preprotein translocase subunit SecE [Effusibacillus lacus]